VRGLNNTLGKRSYDLFTGISQILDKDTVISANLTLGYNHGFLNDPYKVIQRTDIVTLPDGSGGTVDIPVVNTYPENRPNSRFRQVLQMEGTRFFQGANGALDAVLRFSHDDYGILSQAVQLEWRQGVGEKFEVIPFCRYYHQNAASFFHNTLDGLRVVNPRNALRRSFPVSARPRWCPGSTPPQAASGWRWIRKRKGCSPSPPTCTV